jgi:hypothetical protein
MCTKLGSGVTEPTVPCDPFVMRICSGVKWREYDDGIVVYVPATCESHILAKHFATFFHASSPLAASLKSETGTLEQFDREAAISSFSVQFVEELVSLKILDPGN